MTIVLGVLFFLLILSGDLIIDYRKWKKETPIDHSKKWIRGILLLLPTVFLAVPMALPLITRNIYCGFLVYILYWTLFDGVFNLIRGQKWNFNDPDPTDSNTDQIQQKYRWLWVAKIVVSVALIVVYIIKTNEGLSITDS